jgi:hypothetical protein
MFQIGMIRLGGREYGLLIMMVVHKKTFFVDALIKTAQKHLTTKVVVHKPKAANHPHLNTTMKLKAKKLSVALLALAGLALISTGAHANQIYTDGDVFIGFRSTTSPNNGLLFNIGNISQFTNATTFANFSFGSSGTSGADLAAQFGTNWYNDSTVTWGIFSATGSYALLSKAESVNGTQSSAFAAVGSGHLTSLISGIQAVQTGYVGGTGLATAASNTVNAAYETGIVNGTYYYGVNLSPDFSTGGLAAGSSIEGALSKRLDLYYLTPNSVAVLGGGNGASFAIDSTGIISAVPEPSTYLLFGIGALLLAIAYRRRSSHA